MQSPRNYQPRNGAEWRRTQDRSALPAAAPLAGRVLTPPAAPRYGSPMRRFRQSSRHVVLSFLVLAAGLLAVACSTGAEHTAKVINVLEGDLLKVEMGGRLVRVQLAGLNSPVRGQPYRDEARAFTVRLVQGATITVRVVATGDAGHVVGRVPLAGGRDLSRELVAAGLAWHRPGWFARYPALRAAQDQAKSARRGLWRDPNPTPPWEFLGDKSWRSGNEER